MGVGSNKAEIFKLTRLASCRVRGQEFAHMGDDKERSGPF